MLNFKENYILENEMVKLRPLALSDFENLLHFSINEPELWTYSLIQANSEINLKKYIELAINGRENSKEYAFIVLTNEQKNLLEVLGFMTFKLKT